MTEETKKPEAQAEEAQAETPTTAEEAVDLIPAKEETATQQTATTEEAPTTVKLEDTPPTPWHDGLDIAEDLTKFATAKDAIEHLQAQIPQAPPEGYNISIPEGPVKDAVTEALKTAGASQEQATRAAERVNLHMATVEKEAIEARKARIDTLKKHYGETFEQKLDEHSTILNKFGSDKLVEGLKDTGLDANPDFRAFLDNLAPLLSDDLVMSTAAAQVNPSELDGQIAELYKTAATNKADADKLMALLERRAVMRNRKEGPQQDNVAEYII